MDMINPGPGYLDVGTFQSPLGLSAKPSSILPQMSPFIPRPGPPKPVHIDLAEPEEEVYKKHVMTVTQKGCGDPRFLTGRHGDNEQEILEGQDHRDS